MGEFVNEIGTHIRDNLRDRVNAIPPLLTTPVNTVVEAGEKLVSLRPLRAVTHVVEHVGDGVLHFINEQADISCRWRPLLREKP